MEIGKSISRLYCGRLILVALVLACGLAGTAFNPFIAAPIENSGAVGSGQDSKDVVTPGTDSKSILNLADAASRAGDRGKAVSILARLPKDDGAGHFAAGALL